MKGLNRNTGNPIQNNRKIMKMIIRRAALAVSIGGVLWVARLTAQADQAETLEELKAKINELGQKVKMLERNRELDKETAESKAKESPKIALGNQGLDSGITQ